MKNFIFVQWKKPTDASRFVVDGILSEYSGTETQDKIMKILSGVPKYKQISNNKEGLSSSFRCSYKIFNSIILHFIEGNFKERDISGRELVYIFGTTELDSQNAAKILQEYSSILGVSPHVEDIEEIKRQEFKKKTNYNRLILWIIIILILLLSFMLLSHLSNL